VGRDTGGHGRWRRAGSLLGVRAVVCLEDSWLLGAASTSTEPLAGDLSLDLQLAKAVEMTVTNAYKPDLAVGLIRIRDSTERPAEEGLGILPDVVEVTATVENIGDTVADETITRFWVSGTDVERELRIVQTPALLPADAIEVTALWDLRDGSGSYTITAIADAYTQIDEVRKDNNVASLNLIVRGRRVELAEVE
jgi:subtilase family serine protease